MTSTKTYLRRTEQLIKEVNNHPHREEILKLAAEQAVDDCIPTIKTLDTTASGW